MRQDKRDGGMRFNGVNRLLAQIDRLIELLTGKDAHPAYDARPFA